MAGNKTHAAALPASLATSFDTGALSDVTIVSHEKTWHLHKNIVAANTDYFNNLFTKSMAETAQNVVTIHDDKPAALDAVFEYSYKGKYHASHAKIIHKTAQLHLHLDVVVVADKYGHLEVLEQALAASKNGCEKT